MSGKENTDAQQWQHWDKTNEAAFFEVLFKRWYPVLCRSIFRMTGDKEQAEDIVQDVFIHLWDNKDTIAIRVSLKSYLFRACINRTLNAEKRKKTFLHSDISEREEIHASSDIAESEIRAMQLEERIHEAIQALPPGCRQIFILSREEELSYKEIAETLDISVKTVENQMGKALKIMREYLREFMFLFIYLNL